MTQHDAFCVLPEYHHGECSAIQWEEDWDAAYRSMLLEAVTAAVKEMNYLIDRQFNAMLGVGYVSRWIIEWSTTKAEHRLVSPACLTEGGRGRDVALHDGVASAMTWERYSRPRAHRTWERLS